MHTRIMRNCLVAAVLVLGLALSTACSPQGPSSDGQPSPGETVLPTVELVYASFSTPGDTYELIMSDYFARLEEVSAGRIRVGEKHYSQSLVKQADVVDALKTGFVDIHRSVGQYYPELRPYHSVTNLPFTIESLLAAFLAQSDLAAHDARFTQDDVNTGGKTLFVLGVEDFAMLFKEPIGGLDDWKGLNLRAPTKSTQAVVQGMGANPVTVQVSEMYEALQRGTIDGTSGTITGMIGNKWHEVAPWLCDWRFGVLWDISPMMSLPTWEGLHPADQKLMLDIGEKCMLDFTVQVKTNLAAAPALLEAMGGGVITIPESDKAAAKDRLWPIVFDEWEKNAQSWGVTDPQELYDTWVAAMAGFSDL